MTEEGGGRGGRRGRREKEGEGGVSCKRGRGMDEARVEDGRERGSQTGTAEEVMGWQGYMYLGGDAAHVETGSS